MSHIVAAALQPSADASAITPSDTADVPTGACRGLFIPGSLEALDLVLVPERAQHVA